MKTLIFNETYIVCGDDQKNRHAHYVKTLVVMTIEYQITNSIMTIILL